VCVSSADASVIVNPDGVAVAAVVDHGSDGVAEVAAPAPDGDAVPALQCVWTVLRDSRMLAHDDGEGQPLRYMSLYGGMVTTLL
jgi:hypothetical protein